MPVFSAPTSKNASNGCAKRPLRRRSVLKVQESKLVLTRTHYVPMPCARWQGSNWCDDPNSWHDGRKAGELMTRWSMWGWFSPRRKNTSAVHWMRGGMPARKNECRTTVGALGKERDAPPPPPEGKNECRWSRCVGGVVLSKRKARAFTRKPS